VHGYGYRFIASPSVRTAAGGVASPSPRVGDALPARPHWHLVRELGKGGFGSVWLVEHEKTREQRVFKLAGDGAALQALKREITLYRLLQGSLGERAAIVRILDWNVDEPPYFIEAEYVAGGNLVEWCEARGGIAAVPRDVRIELIARVADALAAAHTIGVLHKDLKPANVLIAGDSPDDPCIRLADFGSGSALEPERLTLLGITRLGLTENRADGDTTSGTLFYLAPGADRGRRDDRARRSLRARRDAVSDPGRRLPAAARARLGARHR
jgi:serine/threonine protein kinase